MNSCLKLRKSHGLWSSCFSDSLRCPRPSLPHSLEAPKMEQPKHQYYIPDCNWSPGATGGTPSTIPSVTQKNPPWEESPHHLQRVFKISLGMACFCLCGRELGVGNNKRLLEPSLVNNSGDEAAKYCPASKMQSTIHLVILIWLPGLRHENSHCKWDLPCIPESPNTICWAECGSLEWQTITSTCLFCSIIWPLVWTRMHNPVFSWGHSCFCCQQLFRIQKTTPKLHIHIFTEPKPF